MRQLEWKNSMDSMENYLRGYFLLYMNSMLMKSQNNEVQRTSTEQPISADKACITVTHFILLSYWPQGPHSVSVHVSFAATKYHGQRAIGDKRDNLTYTLAS